MDDKHTVSYTITPPEPGSVKTVTVTENSAKLAQNVGLIKALEDASWLAFIYGSCEVRRGDGTAWTLTVKQTRTPYTAEGHDGTYTLTRKDGKPVAVGDIVTDFRGENYALKGGKAPHKPGSTGSIYLSPPGEDSVHSGYPGVCDLTWVRA